jgi:sugar phosphate isomerase/epimerase
MAAAMKPARPIFLSTVQMDQQLREGRASVLDLAPLAARFGAQGVEYRDVHWKDQPSELSAVKRQLVQYKLRATYTTLMPLYDPDPAHQHQLMQDLDDARELGAVLLRVNLGPRPTDTAAHAQMHYAARKAAERAAGLRVALSIENNSQAPGHAIGELEAALAAFSCRWVGTNIDYANYVTTDQDPLAAIRALGRWINYVHAKDAVRTADGWRATFLGHGGLPLKEILAALDATGKSVPFCFEFPGGEDPEGAIRQSLEFLAGL